MTTEQKTRQENQMPSFDLTSCMALMEKMMGPHGEGCDCADMMSQITSQAGMPDEWLKVMSQMMEIHCGCHEEEDQEAQEA